MPAGARLPVLHEQAGVGAPGWTDVAGRVEPLTDAASRWEAVHRSPLPTAASLGLATDGRGEQWFGDSGRGIDGDGGHVSEWPLLVGTSRRRPT